MLLALGLSTFACSVHIGVHRASHPPEAAGKIPELLLWGALEQSSECWGSGLPHISSFPALPPGFSSLYQPSGNILFCTVPVMLSIISGLCFLESLIPCFGNYLRQKAPQLYLLVQPGSLKLGLVHFQKENFADTSPNGFSTRLQPF